MQPGLLSNDLIQTLRAPDTVGKGNNTKDLYFAMGFVFANHWLLQNPSFGGYSGVFAVLPEKKLVFIAVNTLKQTPTDDSRNYSFELWQQIAGKLAPEFPIPKFK